MIEQAQRAVLALGSNQGDRRLQLQTAVDALAETPGVEVVAVSPVYRTAAVGGPDQPDYLNAVALVDTTLSAGALLARGLAVEDAMERVRTERWGPRPIDVDVIVYGEQRSADPELTLPHPRAHQRAFVLRPWHDVDPAAELPGLGPVAELLPGLANQRIELAEDVLEPPK